MNLLAFHSDHLTIISKHLDPCSRVMLKLTCKRMNAIIVIRRPYERMIDSAARYGHLEVLKWMRQSQVKWSAYACEIAACNGHLHILRYLRSEGCLWDTFTCLYAASNGHLEVLKWARENGCHWNSWTCKNARSNGHLEVYNWARENGCPE